MVDLAKAGWSIEWSSRERRSYFFNRRTGDSRWHLPQCFANNHEGKESVVNDNQVEARESTNDTRSILDFENQIDTDEWDIDNQAYTSDSSDNFGEVENGMKKNKDCQPVPDYEDQIDTDEWDIDSQVCCNDCPDSISEVEEMSNDSQTISDYENQIDTDEWSIDSQVTNEESKENLCNDLTTTHLMDMMVEKGHNDLPPDLEEFVERLLQENVFDNQVGGRQEKDEEKEKDKEEEKEEDKEEDKEEEEKNMDIASCYNIVEVRRRRIPRYESTAYEHVVRFDGDRITQLVNRKGDITNILHAVFESLIERLVEGFEAHDRVGFEIHAPSLQYPIWIQLMRRDQVSIQRILDAIARILQSKNAFVLDGNVEIRVLHVEMPQGSGRSNLNEWTKRKRSIIRITNKDHLCLARAIVTAKARIDKETDNTINWNNIRRGQNEQERLAKELHRRAGIAMTPCGLEDVKSFQAVLPDYQVNVVTFNPNDLYLFRGPQREKRLYLLYHDKHFDVVTSLPGLLDCAYFCEVCGKGYQDFDCHRCRKVCKCCFNAVKEECHLEEWIYCSDCNRSFKNQQCYQNHKMTPKQSKVTIKAKTKKSTPSICQRIWRCTVCGTTVKKRHRCGQRYCRNCQRYRPENHLCYMNPIEEENNYIAFDEEDEELLAILGLQDTGSRLNDQEEEETLLTKYIFFDFECTQEDLNEEGSYLHVPNYCVAHRICLNCIHDDNIKQPCKECGQREHVFAGRNTQKDFCKWLLSRENKGVTAIAHNMKGYDGQFILDHMFNIGMCPKVVMNGAKLMSIELKEKARNKEKKDVTELKIIDSSNFIPAPLSSFPKTFGLTEMKKGYFPYLFNTKSNESYLGPWPPVDTYNPDHMKPEQRKAFLVWYEQQKNKTFNMAREMYEYCCSDVELLRRGCLKFRKDFLEVTGEDPFRKSITISMACMRVFRRKFLHPETIALVPHRGYHSGDTQSLKALKWLKWIEHDNNRRLRHALSHEGEKHIGPYKIDGWDDELNTGYEFYGCLWHGCPSCFLQRDQKLPSLEKTVEDVYEELDRRRAWLKNEGRIAGWQLVEIWECEFEDKLTKDPAMREYIESLQLSEPLEPRDAFYGGRTNAIKLQHTAQDGDKIKYVDVCSLYPWVNKYCKYPIGHPTIIKAPDSVDVSQYEGLIKCSVLPPRGLYHPVLPYRCHNKLLFPLCATCAKTLSKEKCKHDENQRVLRGTWVSCELLKAVEMGYRILHVEEVWHFDTTAQYDPSSGENGLFNEYIDTFLKMKQEASGWPEGCDTEEQRRQYVEDYAAHEGIWLNPQNIVKNEGQRALAKLMLNSFWGKFGQRSTLTKTEIVNNPEKYFKLLLDKSKEVKYVHFNDKLTVRIQWVDIDDYIEVSPNTNIFNAAYTTAHARLKLYSYIERLEDRVLYFDTDSVIYVHRDDRWNPTIGNFLGDMTDELEKPYGAGSHITEFVSGGPKNYAYKVHSTTTDTIIVGECKVRGITLDHNAIQDVNFEAIEKMVAHVDPDTGRSWKDGEEVIIPVQYSHRIQRDGPGKVITKTITKDYRLVYDKRVIQPDLTTLPYGF